MKSLSRIALVFAVVALALGAGIAGEVDYKNCGICKPMMAAEGLMQNMKWESHSIATGMLSVTAVTPEFEEIYNRVHKEMMVNVAKRENGWETELCPFCTRMTQLAEAGAEIEHIEANGAHITTITAADAKVVEKIHAHLSWVQDTMEKQHEDHGEGHGHDHGHDHGS